MAGVAGLQAKRPGIGRDVGAALEDDADHAERGGDTLEPQPVRLLPLGEHPADGIREPGDVLERCRDGFETAGVEHQPVEERTLGAACLRIGDIAGIGGQDARRADARICDAACISARFLSSGRALASARGGARAVADIGHQRRDILRLFSLVHRVQHVQVRCFFHTATRRASAMSSRCTISARPA